jgi:hypothetical protein
MAVFDGKMGFFYNENGCFDRKNGFLMGKWLKMAVFDGEMGFFTMKMAQNGCFDMKTSVFNHNFGIFI